MSATSLTFATPKAERNLQLAIGFSVALHGILLALHFEYPNAARAFQDKALEIILVNAKSAHRPSDAQALAQANLDGGGNTDQKRRLKTPLPPSEIQRSGNELEQAQKRVQALEEKQKRLLEQAKSTRTVAPQADEPVQADPAPAISGRDLADRALAMARFEGEIARNADDYNKRPRKRNIGTRTDEYRFAQYVEDWRLKVERVGTLNYPEAAKGKLYGSLILSLTIKRDGSVDKIEIDRSSGHRVLDDAARRIVTMAAPYAPFPPAIARDTDLLEITRTWNFTSGNQLETR
jgi:protein TonB